MEKGMRPIENQLNYVKQIWVTRHCYCANLATHIGMLAKEFEFLKACTMIQIQVWQVKACQSLFHTEVKMPLTKQWQMSAGLVIYMWFVWYVKITNLTKEDYKSQNLQLNRVI